MAKKVIAYSIMLVLLFSLSAILANAQFKEGTCKSPDGAKYCGQKSRISNCYCDNKCTGYKDCCLDFIEACPGLVSVPPSGGGSGGGGGGGGNLSTTTCTDSDGGNYPYVKGIINTNYPGWTPNVPESCTTKVSDGVHSNVDSCSGDNCYVHEYYCLGNIPYGDFPKCTNGCKDGACIQTQKCQFDSDCPPITCITTPCPQNKCVNNQCVPVETSIKVISPKANQNLIKGNTHVIEWVNSGNYVGPFDIFLIKGGKVLFDIAFVTSSPAVSPADNYFSYDWVVSNSYEDGSDYQIRVSNQNGDIFGESDKFAISSSPVCGNNICDKGEDDYCPPCTTDPCPLASTVPCYKGTCPSDCQTGLPEEVTCIFQGSTSEQKCYYSTLSGNFGCSGITSCATNVTGKKGEKITWKSSCGGYAYTIIDGINEYASFNCSRTHYCEDIDGGLNYNVRGSTIICQIGNNTGGCGAALDFCTGSTLTEGYCINDQTRDFVQYGCPNGCQDGACKPKPCTKIYKPVCGSDGKTYQNSCMAENAGVKIACQKACPCKKEITKQDVIDYIQKGGVGTKITKHEAINWVNTNCYQSTTTTDSITGAVINKAPIIIP